MRKGTPEYALDYREDAAKKEQFKPKHGGRRGSRKKKKYIF